MEFISQYYRRIPQTLLGLRALSELLLLIPYVTLKTVLSLPQVVNATCTEIHSVQPSQVCVGTAQSLTVIGRGFLKQLIPGRGGCRFKTRDGEIYSKHCACSMHWHSDNLEQIKQSQESLHSKQKAYQLQVK